MDGCSVQPLSHVRFFATPWTAARQASLSITNSQSLLRPISFELVMGVGFGQMAFLHQLVIMWVFSSNFSGGSGVKNLPANAGDTVWIPRPGRSPGGGNGSPFQHACLGNSGDRGAWWATCKSMEMQRVRHHLMTKQQLPLRVLLMYYRYYID